METQKYDYKASPAMRMHAGGGSLVIGAIIVVVGLVLLLDNMGLVSASHIWRFWPVGLIALGLARITESHRPAALVWGGLMAVIGALLLLDNLDIIVFNAGIIWPLVLIAFGVSMLLRSLERRKMINGIVVDSSSTVSHYGIFSGGKRRVDSQDFRGGEVFVLFGGFQIDLRNAKMPTGHAIMDVNSMFGGVELTVPDTWRVTSKGMGIFGGFEDKTLPPPVADGVPVPELIVTGSSIFGGATIRNRPSN